MKEIFIEKWKKETFACVKPCFSKVTTVASCVCVFCKSLFCFAVCSTLLCYCFCVVIGICKGTVAMCAS